MKKETILKLLKSSNYDDVILGLNYIKDYTWKQLLDIADNSSHNSIKIYNEEAKGNAMRDNYLLNGNIYCHYNYAINIYNNGIEEWRHIEYIQL